jgi:hypothetical protein
MKKPILMTVSLIVMSLSSPGQAEDRLVHFKGKSAETLEQAVSNFSEANTRMAEVLAKKTLAPMDMHEVHQLTYTLENALKKINKELEGLEETLEKVHVASESGKVDVVRAQGKDYLDIARKVIK